MTTYYPEFGRMISEHLLRLDRSQAWLADQMGVDNATISRWMNDGKRPRNPHAVERLADVLGIHKREERSKLAAAAGFAVTLPVTVSDQVDGGKPQVDGGKPQVDGRKPHEDTEYPDLATFTARPNPHFLFGAATEWGKTMTGWYDDAPEHARSSWAGMTLHTLSLLGKRFTPEGVLTLCAALVLWLFTWNLVAPILRWPLDIEPVRRDACIRLAVAAVLIPFLLSLFTRAEGIEKLDERTWRVHLCLWALKLAGAMTGFDVFVALAVIASLVWYYLTGSPTVGLASGLFTLLPVFWGYIAARRIPLDRLKMYEGKLQMHSADWLVLVVYPFFGVLLAWIIYEWHWLLANPFWGPLTLLACVSLIAALELRNKRRQNR